MVTRNLLLASRRSSGPLIEQIPLAGIQASDISVARNGEVIYASFAQPLSLFTSVDGGTTWQTTTLPGSLYTPFYFQCFNDGNTVLTGNPMHESVDSGATWIPYAYNYINNTGNRYSFSQPVGFAASADRQIIYALAKEYYKNPYSAGDWYETSNLYKSVDLGLTYNLVTPDPLGFIYTFSGTHLWCSNDGQTGFVCAAFNSYTLTTYRTFDGFSTLSVIPNPPDNAIRIKGSSDASVLVCNVCSGWQSVDTEFYVSTDFGTSWEKITSIGTVKTADAYDFDVTDDGKTLVVLGNTGVTKYTNF